MADIFHEIDEDLRRERLGKIWSRYGAYIIGFAVLIVVAVGAWRGYEWWQHRQAQASGARFAAALQLAEAGKHAEAEAAFRGIAGDGTNGYRMLARFRAAAELAPTDRAGAVAAYDALAADSGLDPLARDMARLRAAMLLVDTGSPAEIEARVKPLDTPTGAFRHSARELTGLAQYRAGDYAAATKSFEAILADSETPPGLRQRAELMRTLASGGAPTTVAPAPEAAPTLVVPPALQTTPETPPAADASPSAPELSTPGLPAPAAPPAEEPVPPVDAAPATPPAAEPATPAPAPPATETPAAPQ